MLTVVSGNLGDGKTLFLTIFGMLSTRQVISNYKLEREYESFSMAKFVSGGYNDALILIDEAYSLLESRDFMTSENKAMSYVLFQSRKKSLDMILTVQLKSTLDIRFRELADILVEAYGLIKRKGQIYFKYIIYPRGKNPRTIYLSLEKAQSFFDKYDTNEVIEPLKKEELLNEIMTRSEKEVKVKDVATYLLKKYPDVKITKNTIKYELFKNRWPESIKDFVYEEIRLQKQKELMDK